MAKKKKTNTIPPNQKSLFDFGFKQVNTQSTNRLPNSPGNSDNHPPTPVTGPNKRRRPLVEDSEDDNPIPTPLTTKRKGRPLVADSEDDDLIHTPLPVTKDTDSKKAAGCDFDSDSNSD